MFGLGLAYKGVCRIELEMTFSPQDIEEILTKIQIDD